MSPVQIDLLLAKHLDWRLRAAPAYCSKMKLDRWNPEKPLTLSLTELMIFITPVGWETQFLLL